MHLPYFFSAFLKRLTGKNSSGMPSVLKKFAWGGEGEKGVFLGLTIFKIFFSEERDSTRGIRNYMMPFEKVLKS